VHGHENRIHANERNPEVDLADAFVQEPAKHLREPEVRAGEHSENGCNPHDQVKVRDNEVRVV